MGVLQSVCLQSNSSLSGSELYSQKVVGVVFGFTCCKHRPRPYLYGFSQLKPDSDWRFDYFIPPLANTGTSSSFLLALATMNSEIDMATSKIMSLADGVMKVIHLETSENPY